MTDLIVDISKPPIAPPVRTGGYDSPARMPTDAEYAAYLDRYRAALARRARQRRTSEAGRCSKPMPSHPKPAVTPPPQHLAQAQANPAGSSAPAGPALLWYCELCEASPHDGGPCNLGPCYSTSRFRPTWCLHIVGYAPKLSHRGGFTCAWRRIDLPEATTP